MELIHQNDSQYRIVFPGVEIECDFGVFVTADPTDYYMGVWAPDPDISVWAADLSIPFNPEQAGAILGGLGAIVATLQTTVAQLIAHTYNAGQVLSPYAALPGPNIPMFYRTNYLGTTTVGVQWQAVLALPTAKVYFTMKERSSDTTPEVDVECTVTDPNLVTIEIALTRSNLVIKTTEYFWQLQARTFTTDNPPVVDEVWVMQEGKALVKPTFKG